MPIATIREFLKLEAAAGIVLVISAGLALVMANTKVPMPRVCQLSRRYPCGAHSSSRACRSTRRCGPDRATSRLSPTSRLLLKRSRPRSSLAAFGTIPNSAPASVGAFLLGLALMGV